MFTQYILSLCFTPSMLAIFEVVAVVGIVLGSQHLYLILSFFSYYEATESGCSLSLW